MTLPKPSFEARDAVGLVGVAALGVGVGLIYLPAALIVLGVLFIAAALRWADSR